MSEIFLGQFLIQKKIISEEDLRIALEYQNRLNLSIGKLAVEKGFLSHDQVQEILLLQQKADEFFGEIAEKHGYLSHRQVEKLLESKKARYVYLGEVLLALEFMTPEQYAHLLPEYVALEKERDSIRKSSIKEEDFFLVSLLDALEKSFLRFTGVKVKVDRLRDRLSADQFVLVSSFVIKHKDTNVCTTRVFVQEGMADYFVIGIEAKKGEPFIKIVTNYFTEVIQREKPELTVFYGGTDRVVPGTKSLTLSKTLHLVSPKGLVGIGLEQAKET